MWTHNYQRKLTAAHLFEVQEEITQAIVQSLQMQLTPDERRRTERRRTANLEAYQLYVQGRGHFHERTGPALREAVALFQQAIDLNPRYALAWTGISDAVSVMQFYDYSPLQSAPDPMEATRRALDPAQSAVKLNPLAPAYRIFCRQLPGDW